MPMLQPAPLLLAAGALVAGAALTLAAPRPDDPPHKPGYTDTPLLPGDKWHVHDPDRPYPPEVDPGTASTPDQAGKAPSDAVVLFDGSNLDRWQDGRGRAPRWKIEDGVLVIPPRGGPLVTRDEFGDCQLHLEFASPDPPTGEDQARGNSGIEFFRRYEIQLLDSYKAPTYADGQAAAIYGQHPPLVNASRPPGQWQTYDILFTAPRFKEDGSVETPAYVTMLHNGVLVHNHAEVYGPVQWRGRRPYEAHGPKGQISLQDHGSPVRFRNIWVRPLATD